MEEGALRPPEILWGFRGLEGFLVRGILFLGAKKGGPNFFLNITFFCFVFFLLVFKRVMKFHCGLMGGGTGSVG